MDMSDFLEDKLLNHILNATTWAVPASTYIALFTVAPDDAGAGGTEVPTGASLYEREIVTADWTVSAGPTVRAQNASVIDFGVSGTDWGIITTVGIYTAITAGDLLFHGGLTANRDVMTGDSVEFAIGTLGVTLD